MIIAALALAASLVLDGGDLELREPPVAAAGPTATVPPPTTPRAFDSFTVCTSASGQIAFCAPSGEMYCWDSRAVTLRSCVNVMPWKPRTGHTFVWYVLVTAAGSGWDILTTGISIHRGAHERNPLLPTPEIRSGAKVVGGLAISGGLWLVDHGFHHPRIAKWMALIADAVYLGVGIHNLQQGRR